MLLHALPACDGHVLCAMVDDRVCYKIINCSWHCSRARARGVSSCASCRFLGTIRKFAPPAPQSAYYSPPYSVIYSINNVMISIRILPHSPRSSWYTYPPALPRGISRYSITSHTLAVLLLSGRSLELPRMCNFSIIPKHTLSLTSWSLNYTGLLFMLRLMLGFLTNIVEMYDWRFVFLGEPAIYMRFLPFTRI